MGARCSCCLPYACGGGGRGGVTISGATPEAKKGSTGRKCRKCRQKQQQQSQQLLQDHQQKQQEKDQDQQQEPKKVLVVQVSKLAPLSNLDEELEDLENGKGAEQGAEEEEDFSKEGGTQHRLSPRLHDIKEEDDEDGRNTKGR